MTMSHAITMPALSDTMSNGRLVKWRKKPGDVIKKGEVIAEVETDKAVMDVEAFEDGFLSGPLAAEGTEAPVGEVIGYIANSDNEIASMPASAAARVPQKTGDSGLSAPIPVRPWRTDGASEAQPISPVLAAAMTSARPKVRSTPVASIVKPASAVPGQAAAPSSPLDAGPPYRIERASSLREAVARNMIASASTPAFRVSAQLPIEPLAKLAKERQQSLTLSLARACALAVVEHPLFNAAYTPEGLARRERVDIGIAVDNGDGLITPVLRDAARRSLDELAKDWAFLRDKVGSRRLVPADYSGATFYLSDLGVFSVVEEFDSIIPPGAAAILSVAASRPQGAYFTLACDHRVVFGADAARFLETLRQKITDPSKLLA